METPDNAQDEHRRFLEENHARISHVAHDGYHTHGRGAIFMFEDAILDVLSGQTPTVTIEYVADGSEALERRGGWPTDEHAELVQRYDPEGAMIILVGRRRGGRELFTYQMLFESGSDDSDVITIHSLIG